MSGKSDPIRQTSPNFRTQFRGKPCETIDFALIPAMVRKIGPDPPDESELPD